jgi:hypothetical protein
MMAMGSTSVVVGRGRSMERSRMRFSTRKRFRVSKLFTVLNGNLQVVWYQMRLVGKQVSGVTRIRKSQGRLRHEVCSTILSHNCTKVAAYQI